MITRAYFAVGLAVVCSLIIYSILTVEQDYMDSEQHIIMHLDKNEYGNTTHVERKVKKFHKWSRDHKKSYGNQEVVNRFKTWHKHRRLVKEHNAQNLTWTLELNKFADLEHEEFQTLHTTHKPKNKNKTKSDNKTKSENNTFPDDSGLKMTQATAAQVPTTQGTVPNIGLGGLSAPQASLSFDWRDKGAVGPIRWQGACGACYAFASVAALEALNQINSGNFVEFSVQQAIDCTSKEGVNNGCGGGYAPYVFNYIKDAGIQTESSYPYEERVAECRYDPNAVVFKPTGYKKVEPNAEALLAAVTAQPVVVAIEASGINFQLYSRGVVTKGGINQNHAVTIVGYGTEVVVNTRTKKTEIYDYWIAKNHWGEYWGEGGYVRILRGNQNQYGCGVCGINCYASYPVL